MSLQNTLTGARIQMAQDVQDYLEAMGSRVIASRFGYLTPLLIVDEPPRLLQGAATELNVIIDGHQRRAWVVSHNGCRVMWREYQEGICKNMN